MFIEIATEQVVGKLWSERARIIQFLADTKNAITRGELELFAFGPGGSGKSTLGSLISGEYTLETLPATYSLSLEMEEYTVSGRNFIALYVPPGQEDKRAYHWDELYKKMASANRYAIINFLCWGYHSLSKIDLADHALYKPGMSTNDFLSLYLAERRTVEVAIMRELIPHLKSTPGKLRLITLVTKQDLWWDERTQVRQHYQNGEYGGLIEEIRRHKGDAHFSHDYASCALNLLNFRTQDGVVLKNTVSGYDKNLFVGNYNELIGKLRGILN